MPQARDATPMAATGPCVAAEEIPPGSDSDGQWHLAPRTNASLTESLWKSFLIHADLAGVRCADLFVAHHTADPPDRPARHSPNLPRRIPLLI